MKVYTLEAACLWLLKAFKALKGAKVCFVLLQVIKMTLLKILT